MQYVMTWRIVNYPKGPDNYNIEILIFAIQEYESDLHLEIAIALIKKKCFQQHTTLIYSHSKLVLLVGVELADKFKFKQMKLTTLKIVETYRFRGKHCSVIAPTYIRKIHNVCVRVQTISDNSAVSFLDFPLNQETSPFFCALFFTVHVLFCSESHLLMFSLVIPLFLLHTRLGLSFADIVCCI